MSSTSEASHARGTFWDAWEGCSLGREPERLGKLLHELSVRRELDGAGGMRPCRPDRQAGGGQGAGDRLGGDLGRQAEVALTAAAQLEIDLGQQFRIEQGAVLGAA